MPSPESRSPWPWLVGAGVVVLLIALAVWLSAPPENTLPDVYSVM